MAFILTLFGNFSEAYFVLLYLYTFFYCQTGFNLDFYTDVEDLSYLQKLLAQDPRSAKYR